jgi:hypothetical protein
MKRAESGFLSVVRPTYFTKRQILALDIGIRDGYRDDGAYQVSLRTSRPDCLFRTTIANPISTTGRASGRGSNHTPYLTG